MGSFSTKFSEVCLSATSGLALRADIPPAPVYERTPGAGPMVVGIVASGPLVGLCEILHKRNADFET